MDRGSTHLVGDNIEFVYCLGVGTNWTVSLMIMHLIIYNLVICSLRNRPFFQDSTHHKCALFSLVLINSVVWAISITISTLFTAPNCGSLHFLAKQLLLLLACPSCNLINWCMPGG